MRRIERWLLIWLLNRLFARTFDEAVADLTDRLEGWCSPHMRLEP